METQTRTFLCFVMTGVLMMAVVMPHHHHGRLFCLVVELCSQDHTFNDIHTGHSPGERSRDCVWQQMASPVVKTADCRQTGSSGLDGLSVAFAGCYTVVPAVICEYKEVCRIDSVSPLPQTFKGKVAGRGPPRMGVNV